MNSLITGAGGFIGSRLAHTLISKGHSVKALLMPGENGDALENAGAEIFRGDLTDPTTLEGIGKGVDTIFHLAARTSDWGSKKDFERIMVGGTGHLLNATADDISRFIYFSSVAALGLSRDLEGLDENAERVTCGIPYCDTKIVAEDLVKSYCTEHGIDYTIIRPTNVIGPGSVWVKDILDSFRRGTVPLISGGNAPGAFIYVDNLVDGAVLAAESDIAKGKIYHFRDDYDITWGEYIKRLGALIGKKPRGNIPFRAAWIIGHALEFILTPCNIRPPMTRLAAGVLGKNLDINNSRSKRELHWESRVTLDEAMKAIEEWVREHYISTIQGGPK